MGHRLLTGAAVAASLAASSAHADPAGGRVTGTVAVVEADGTAAPVIDAIVYVVGFPEKADPQAVPAQIAQEGRHFVPDLVGVTAGEDIVFPNNDPFLHNVFSQSAARKFDLGSFKKGDRKTAGFPDPGVVDVYCNIHPEMAATILVLPNRRHVRTSPAGAYTLEGVPPGEWTVFAYTRRAVKPVSAKVTVTAKTETKLDLKLVRGAEPEHLNKFGEKYKAGGPTYK